MANVIPKERSGLKTAKLWSTLKTEALPDCGRFDSPAQAKTELFYYIEIFYNRKRLHSSLDSSISRRVRNHLALT